MLKKSYLFLLVGIVLVTFLTSGCAAPAAEARTLNGGGLAQAGPTTGDPAATEAVGCLLPGTPPPYLGLWSMETEDGPQMLTMTESGFYFVESGKAVGEAGGVRERYAEITAVDLEKNQVTLMTKWIRVNGEMAGFDSPQFFMSYAIEDGKLRFGASSEGFPSELSFGPFEQK